MAAVFAREWADTKAEAERLKAWRMKNRLPGPKDRHRYGLWFQSRRLVLVRVAQQQMECVVPAPQRRGSEQQQ
jgi:hypothetical protein